MRVVDDVGHAPEMTAVTVDSGSAYASSRIAELPPAILIRAGGPAGWRLVAKRTMDVIGALALLVVLLPMLLVVAIGVRLSSRGPVFYRQIRVGWHGRQFTMLKFRTFPIDHVPPSDALESDGSAVVPAAQSPLRFGRLLRQTSFDELPQLLNIVRGDMSLVGPRPERPELVECLARRIPGYRDRHRAPVGLTGQAQVLGLCGTTPIEERSAADNAYIDDWSLRRDIAILARTVPTLLRKLRY